MRLLFILLFTSVNIVFSQQFSLRKFDEEKINSNFIYDIKQSSDGELFIASSNGLISYDGITFKTISTENGLLENFINHIYIDKLNTVYVSYFNGGYAKVTNDSIINIDSTTIVTDFIQNDSIFYVATQNKIITILNNNYKDLNIPFTTQLLNLSNGIVLQKDDNNNINIINKSNIITILSNVNFITVDFSKNVLLYIQNNILQIKSINKNGLLKDINSIKFNHDTLAINNFDFFNNYLEISTSSNGIIEYTFSQDFSIFTKKKYNKLNGLANNDIRCSLIDYEGNLWLGSYGFGILQLPYSRISIFENLIGEKKYIINKIIKYNNQIYLGTNNGLISLGDNSKQYLLNYEIIALKVYKNSLWIGTANQGVFELNNNKIKQLSILSNSPPKHINCIQFENNNILLGTNTGLYITDLTTKSTQHITTTEGLAHNIIQHFIIDNDRKFWFDSPNSPIYTYQNGEFDYYKNIEGFESFNVTDIQKGKTNDIWISTAGDGVFQFKDNKYNHFTTKDGLFSDYIYCIENKDLKNIYFGHKNGISAFIQSDSNAIIRHVSNINELEYILPQSNFFYETNLWIGTSTGLVNIPTHFLFNKKFIPNIKFTSVKINKTNASYKNDIELNYGNYFIDFNFKAILLSESDLISYKYKLVGFDKNWTTTSFKTPYAVYQSLNDGQYKFIVKLYINGEYSGKNKTISIIIKKPYWKQLWFFTLVIALVILLFFIVLKIITNRNKKIRKKLAFKIEERTKALNTKNKEIQIINKNLEKLSNQYLEQKNIAINKSRELLKSISYAKRIQKAIFRKTEYNQWVNEFKSLFLIFKPKDNVSGDFYWAEKNGDNMFLAVGDCTGHGVPGAMISMLGISLLGEIIEYETETDNILNELRNKLITKLGQRINFKSIVQSRDGMDIAFLKFNTKTKIAQSSSAYNPIFIVRKKSVGNPDNLKVIIERDDLILYSTHADKQPVGIFEKMTEFKACKFTLFENDNVFMMSDGYQDQFGGEYNKKFLRKRTYQLLLDVYGLDGDEQKKILWNTMKNWMGKHNQIDDIAIVGFTI